MADGMGLEIREAGDVDTPAVEAVVEAAFGEGWWRLDLVGLRDPVLAEIEAASRGS